MHNLSLNCSTSICSSEVISLQQTGHFNDYCNSTVFDIDFSQFGSRSQASSCAVESVLNTTSRVQQITRRLMLGAIQPREVEVCQEQLTLSHDIEFKGHLILQIANQLKMCPGIKVSSRGHMHVTAGNVEKASARLLSESGIFISCNQLDNSNLGEMKAHGQCTLEVNRINNSRGTISSLTESLLWSPKQNGLFDNELGMVRARGKIRFGHAVGHKISSEAILLNENGKVTSARSLIEAYLYHVQNAHGSIRGSDINLHLASLDNSYGQIYGSGLVRVLASENACNISGKVTGLELQLRIDKEFGNRGGLLQATEAICLSADCFTDDAQIDAGNNLGQILSGKGGVLLSTQQPFYMSSDVKATGPVQILAFAGIFNRLKCIIFSEKTIVLSCGPGPGDIALKNCELSASLLKAFAPGGIISMQNIKASGDAQLEAKSSIALGRSVWSTKKYGLLATVQSQGKIDLLEAHIEGEGQLALLGSNEKMQQSSCHSINLSNSHVRLNKLFANCAEALTAKNSRLNFDAIGIKANRLDASHAELNTKTLKVETRLAVAKRAKIGAKLANFYALETIDLTSAQVRGVFQLKAPEVLLQSGMLISTFGSSAIHAKALQTNGKTTFAGAGTLRIQFYAEQLMGKAVLDGNLILEAQHPHLVNHLDIQSDGLHLSASAALRNVASVVTRIAQITAGELFTNEANIEGEETICIKAMSLQQTSETEITARDLFLRISRNLKASELGAVVGNRILVLASAGDGEVDKEILSPGAILLINKKDLGDSPVASSIAKGLATFPELEGLAGVQDVSTLISKGLFSDEGLKSSPTSTKIIN